MSVLKLIPIEFHQSFTVTGIDRCPHISIVSSDRFWVSDVNNGLILSNTQGKTLPQDHWLFYMETTMCILVLSYQKSFSWDV